MTLLSRLACASRSCLSREAPFAARALAWRKFRLSLPRSLGYGLVVPFLACRFALWFRIMKTSPKEAHQQQREREKPLRPLNTHPAPFGLPLCYKQPKQRRGNPDPKSCYTLKSPLPGQRTSGWPMSYVALAKAYKTPVPVRFRPCHFRDLPKRPTYRPTLLNSCTLEASLHPTVVTAPAQALGRPTAAVSHAATANGLNGGG